MESTTTEHAVGARVRQARTAAGLSLRAVAQRIGVSPATLSAIETGKTGASVARLRSLAVELGTTVAWLIGDQASTRADDTPGSERRAVPSPEPPSRSSRRRALDEPGPHTYATADSWREFPPLDIDPVLAAAIDSFVETGYHGATMRSIAARAGMSVPGVYHHYRDKQDLLVRALDLTMDELHRRVRAARLDGANGRERVIRVVEALALFHTHHRELAFIGASEMRSLNPADRDRITSSRNEIQYILDADIDTALAEAHRPTDRARDAGRAIATMCTALPQWFRLDGPSSPEQIATAYADFALGLLGLALGGRETAQPR
ncbi:TetR family transcriptional regulator [Nocardia sp. PE-7]|uniref:TetR family transcriptional regulator n=1 Tax=Nocardia sp. PE-7 TaxID=3058426 RepID=UPI00265A3862|nr:TetR family transcriptional regulator [Nocardia sp. PE-7]WKG11583.1 TetR family transcriptional regulator [Nocardia sp. PE-7]